MLDLAFVVMSLKSNVAFTKNMYGKNVGDEGVMA